MSLLYSSKFYIGQNIKSYCIIPISATNKHYFMTYCMDYLKRHSLSSVQCYLRGITWKIIYVWPFAAIFSKACRAFVDSRISLFGWFCAVLWQHVLTSCCMVASSHAIRKYVSKKITLSLFMPNCQSHKYLWMPYIKL